MKKRILSFFVLLLAFSFAYAEPVNCPFVWKVEKKGEPVSYLVGTVHFNKKDTQLSGCLKEVVDNADMLMTETFFVTSPDELMQTDIIPFMQISINKNNPNQLKDDIGEKLHGQLREVVKKSEMSSLLTVFDYFYAWSALMNTMGIPLDNHFSAQNGIDLLLSQYAKEKSIKRMGLESIMEQVPLFKELPKDKIVQSMEITFANEQELAKEQQEMIDAYNSGNIKKLEELLYSDKQFRFFSPQDKVFWKKWLITDLLENRTSIWLPKILIQLPKEKNVIATGVGHMFGDKGLVKLLQNNGYTVTYLQ
ncbi:MAG: TraB/GumN family protein [Neisseriaceae bacterium]|nr:TraB/GumN family protein [Neisseriaceae bacterium]